MTTPAPKHRMVAGQPAESRTWHEEGSDEDMHDKAAYMREYRKRHYRYKTELHGHTVTFTGERDGEYIDVAYDGAGPTDAINMYDYAAGVSRMDDRDAFMEAVREYLRNTSAEDADAMAEYGR